MFFMEGFPERRLRFEEAVELLPMDPKGIPKPTTPAQDLLEDIV